MNVLAPTITTHQLAAASQVTFRRIDYWCRTGLLHPATDADGSGTRREWHRSHVKVCIALDAIIRVNSSGSSDRDPQVVRAACWFDDHRHERWTGDYSISLTPVSRLVLDLAEIEARAAEAFA